MITTTCTCDNCGAVITASNGLPSIINIPRKGKKVAKTLPLQDWVEIKGPSEYSKVHVCLHCFIDAVNALDDRPSTVP